VRLFAGYYAEPINYQDKDNIMKQLLRRYGVLVSLLMLTVGSTATLAADGTPVMTRIQKSGELVLGTSANMEPMTFKRSDGTVVGFDVNLAGVMASGMGVKLVTRVMPFDELIPALRSGKVDVVISNMTINPSRNMNVAFVGPYLTSGKCVVTREETLAKADEAGDLDIKDVHLAVLKGSTSEKFVRTLMPNADVKTIENIQEGADLVASGKVSGMLTDLPVCLATIKNNPDAGFVTVVSLLSYEPIGIAVAGDDPLLINWTENFLERLTQTAALDLLAVKWLGDLVPRQLDEEEED
jgi:polar amino acid transport system substrate-binding protein